MGVALGRSEVADANLINDNDNDNDATAQRMQTITVGTSNAQTYSNTADYRIRDRRTVESRITVSGRSGNAPASVPVAVGIVDTYRGAREVDFVAPDGSVYVLHNRSGGSADNIDQTARPACRARRSTGRGGCA